MYGYMDESGAPGVAMNGKDCLLVSLVIFQSEEARDESILTIENLRAELRLAEDYEFHCSSNSTKAQAAFLKLLTTLDFRFITVAIHKNAYKKTASYARLSGLLVNEIATRFPNLKIEMDSNPTLHAELRKKMRECNARGVKICERNSRSSRLIQVADYVVNISAKKVKNTPNARNWYGLIAKKMLAFIEVAD